MARKPTVVRKSAGPKVIPMTRVADQARSRVIDSLQNLITGMGTSRDKTTGTQFVFSEMDRMQLEAAYRSDWIARKVINIPAEDACREWRDWESDKQEITDLETVERELNVAVKVQQAMIKARLYGGAALLIGVNQGGMSTELDLTKVGKDSLKFLHVVSRYELTAGEMDWNVDSEYYGTPKYYRRNQIGDAQSLEQIHPSRVVRFLGNPLPDVTQSQGWGDSILQALFDAIVAAGSVCSNGAAILQEIKMDVIKIPNLSGSLANKDYEERLTARFAMANLTKSLYNILLLDSEEEWSRQTANLTGIPDILQMYMLVASGAADIPATRLLGQSPKGLNSTGENDIRNYYDRVATEQSTMMTPAMARLDEVLVRSAIGTANPEDVTYTWKPLWQMDEVQKGALALTKAQAHQVDVTAALIPDQVLRDARINQLIEDGVYPGLEQILQDFGPLQDIPEVDPNAQIDPTTGLPMAPAIDPKTGKPVPPQAANQNAPPKGKAPSKKPLAVSKKAAVGDMADRVRRANPKRKQVAYTDAIFRSLYVSRQVMNAKDIVQWAKEQGFDNIEPTKEMHVTIMYSRTPVDWTKTGSTWSGEDEYGGVRVKPGGMRAMDKFNNALVLCFNCSELSWRHSSLKSTAGCEWDYEDYQPHITIAYNTPMPEGVQAYQGAIELGPEIYQEAGLDELGDERPFLIEDYNENHDPGSGEFTFGPAGGSGNIKTGTKVKLHYPESQHHGRVGKVRGLVEGESAMYKVQFGEKTYNMHREHLRTPVAPKQSEPRRPLFDPEKLKKALGTDEAVEGDE